MIGGKVFDLYFLYTSFGMLAVRIIKWLIGKIIIN